MGQSWDAVEEGVCQEVLALPPLTQGRPCPHHLGFPTLGSLGAGPRDCALPAPSRHLRLQSTAEGVLLCWIFTLQMPSQNFFDLHLG